MAESTFPFSDDEDPRYPPLPFTLFSPVDGGDLNANLAILRSDLERAFRWQERRINSLEKSFIKMLDRRELRDSIGRRADPELLNLVSEAAEYELKIRELRKDLDGVDDEIKNSPEGVGGGGIQHDRDLEGMEERVRALILDMEELKRVSKDLIKMGNEEKLATSAQLQVVSVQFNILGDQLEDIKARLRKLEKSQWRR